MQSSDQTSAVCAALPHSALQVPAAHQEVSPAQAIIRQSQPAKCVIHVWVYASIVNYKVGPNILQQAWQHGGHHPVEG